MGAVVLQAQDNPTGNLPARNVIDGQQRLTTLQLLMDATGAVLLGVSLLTAARRAAPLPDLADECGFAAARINEPSREASSRPPEPTVARALIAPSRSPYGA
ncbi:DUF262 domain-containing protein [Nocardioides psychrotolerans]|uniref:DUF262 domain-containing protein n=1 Tax=Nocardioides psychrotolerans TaxID=1005945 RepID=UPI00210DCFD3|nr:DUF262 domain-containing protein [Nocardioides psychrotolerans]